MIEKIKRVTAKALIWLLQFVLGKKEHFENKNIPCYDKEGKYIGWFSRSMATALFLFCNDKNGKTYVLASKRGDGAADFKGMWNSSCGYLDFNETVRECAVRETYEETGVKVDPRHIIFIGYEDNPSTTNRQNVTFRFGYHITTRFIDDFELKPCGGERNEVAEIKWIPYEDVDKYVWAFGHEKRIHEIANALHIA